MTKVFIIGHFIDDAANHEPMRSVTGLNGLATPGVAPKLPIALGEVCAFIRTSSRLAARDVTVSQARGARLRG
jgi:hypothetical protein